MTAFEKIRAIAEEKGLRPVDKSGGFACDCPLPHKARERHVFVYKRKDGGATVACKGGQGHDEDAIVGAFGLTMDDVRPLRPPADGGCTLEDYAAAKRLPVPFLASLGLTTTRYQGEAAVKIPHRNEDGVETSVLFRTQAEPRATRWKKDSKAIPYGLDRLRSAKATGRITIVEGQSDCHALWLHGEPALGLPGAGGWNEAVEKALDGFATIHVVIEPDEAGEGLRKRLATSPLRERIRLVRLGADKDPCGLRAKNPDGFPAAWAGILAAAPRLVDELEGERKARFEAAREACSSLLPRPDLLSDFARDVERLVAGETANAKVLLLALTSRVLARPVSPILKGPSSAGKSHLVASVLRFVPEYAYFEFTATSDRALVFDERPLSHRFVVLYEAGGMASDMSQYIMRSLLSEGRIRYAITERAPDGKHATREIVREGPTGLVMTTTRTTIHAENETRHLSLTVSDTREQTKLVMAKIAEEGEGPPPPDFARWQALQDVVALSGLQVTIPWAGTLASLVRPEAVRLRRDFATVLALVRSHALLHLGTRKRDSKGRVVATMADYVAVRALVGDAISEGVGATIPEQLKETVRAVSECAGLETCSLAAVADRLQVDKSAASRRIRRAADQGFVVNDEARKGHPARFRLGLPVPDDFDVLPTAEALEAAWRGDAWEGDDDPTPLADRVAAAFDGERVACPSCGGTAFSSVGQGSPVCVRCHPGKEAARA